MKLHVNEIKRQCDESLQVSRRRRRTQKKFQELDRELVAIIVGCLAITAVFAIAAALKGWGVW